MRTTGTFLGEREFLLSCLPLFAVVPKAESSLFTECPTASGSSRWPLRRALQLPGLLVPSPGAHGCSPQRHLFVGLVPHPRSPVTGFRVSWVCFLFSPQLLHRLSPSPKSATFKQLLLISVSHWCRSFLYCKETYLRLLIAVWFGVFLQTPFVPWGQ